MSAQTEPHRKQAAAHLATVGEDPVFMARLETSLRLAQIHAILHVGEKLDELARALEGVGQ